MLPCDFINLLEESLGLERSRALISALADESVVSVRANTAKISLELLSSHFSLIASSPVAWAGQEGLYLDSRPSFTNDPLFHAGAYYVQEASSMYVGSLLGEGEGRMILDLCAAPGGKSTHLLSRCGPSDLLVANEAISSRVGALSSNIARWGLPNVVVTNNDPSAFSALEGCFDFVLVDAPCSGEGMFRKDREALEQWSLDNVKLCAARQRRILSDVWPSLAQGGQLIYSTCTFNHLEDEDNARWICSSLGGDLVSERHFLPGSERGEGFYCAEIRKKGSWKGHRPLRIDHNPTSKSEASQWVNDDCAIFSKGDLLKAYPKNLSGAMRALESKLRVVHSAVAVAQSKGRDLIPQADLALSTILKRGLFPECDLSLEEALKYLSRQTVVLPGAPLGFILITYNGFPLGFVKNLGPRANNLYPQSLRIRDCFFAKNR